MSTRGLWGFLIDGETKATYNHFDSYPSDLGNIIKNFILDNDKDEIKSIAKIIKLVEQTDKNYDLLYDAQNNPQIYIDGLFNEMIDSINFILDSLFCEWAYIINLDTEKLEIYKGFQESPPKNNRYGSDKMDNQGYFPCEMIKEIPFNELNSFDMNTF